MGSMERSKKRLHLWKKAIIHFMICFIMGFFTGIAPTKKTPIFTSHVLASNPSEFSPKPVKFFHQEEQKGGIFNRTLLDQKSKSIQTRPNNATNLKKERNEANLNPRRLIIVVSPTSSKDRLKGVFLRRLANTLRLVDPPLLWVVVDPHSDSSEVPEILRKTGIMYRHLVYDHKNFIDPQVEMDHQMNIALNHIEHHRLSGVVHFARLSNNYDLSFFEEIRAIEVFGTWPMAFLSANRNKVIIEGPVCGSSEVIIGWHLRNIAKLYPLHISSFAFNSSILWDPERWGRPSSVQDTSQNSLNFVKKEVFEEESKVKGIPSEGCSKIMLWHLHFPKGKS